LVETSMNQIQPHRLWIGNAGDGGNFREIFDKGIQAVIQLALEEPPIHLPRSLIYSRFPLVDGNGNDPCLLYLAIKSVAFFIEQQMPILVCCGAGMSRSPAIVAAALSSIEKTTLQDCLEYVSQYHATDVSSGLWDQIIHIMNNEYTELKW
jgi:protein-tyrosine phosphatase